MSMGFFDLGTGETAESIKAHRTGKKIGCDACGLSKSCNSPKLLATGKGLKKILIIGDAPGKSEDEQGTPGVGMSATRIEEVLSDIGIDFHKDCRYINSIGCFSKGEISDISITECRGRILQEIKDFQPLVIIPMGSNAVNSIIGHKLQGRLSRVSESDFFSEQIPDQDYKIWICPTLHPRDLMRNEKDKISPKIWKSDIKRAIKLIQDNIPCPVYDFASNCFITENETKAISILDSILLQEHLIAYDYETTGLKPQRKEQQIVSVSIAFGNEAWAFPFFQSNEFREKWKLVLTNPNIGKIAHKLDFENGWTYYKARPESGAYWPSPYVWDTCLGAHCINNNKPTSLKFNSYIKFGIIGYDDKVDKYITGCKQGEDPKSSNHLNTIHECGMSEILPYNAMDSLLSLKLYPAQRKLLNSNQIKGLHFFIEGSEALSRVQAEGMKIDIEQLNMQNKRLNKRIQLLENSFQDFEEIQKWKSLNPGKQFNPNSNPQISNLVYDILKYTKPEEGPKTDEDALSKIKLPFVNAILSYRKFNKMRDTYLAGYSREVVDERVYPFFNLHLVSTFRSSSDSPNFQNVPKRDPQAKAIIRSTIIPSKGNRLKEFDYKGVEVATSCIVGNTEIETLEGKQRITDIINKINNNIEVHTFGYCLDKKRIAASKIIAGGITKLKAPVYKVTLDNDQFIIATEDHKFMMRDESYCELKNLKPFDSLMPYYTVPKVTGHKTVYTKVYLNNGQSILQHNLIALDLFGINISKSDKVVHHKNHNGTDNSLLNITIINRKEHMKIHSKEGWKNKGIGERHKNIDYKALALKNKEVWKNKSEEEKRHHSEQISAAIKLKGNRFGSNNSMFGKKQSEESKLKNRLSHLGKPSKLKGIKSKYIVSQETRLKQSLARKGRIPWNIGKHLSQSIKDKISKTLKGRVFSQVTKNKLKLVSSNTWKKLKLKGKEWECKICHRLFYKIPNRHLSDKHNISTKEYKETYNHKVKSIEFYGYEDVYNITVEGIHNYAVGAGVILKNCCYHKDPNMIKYIIDPTTDMHRDTAMDLFFKTKTTFTKDERQAAKNGFVFPEFYGSNYMQCAPNIWDMISQETKDHLNNNGVRNLKDFTRHVERIEDTFWGERFPAYKDWKYRIYREYEKQGYLDSYTGFRLYGPMKFTEATNYQIQGSAFHCLLWTLIKTQNLIKQISGKSKIIGQIHDAMVVDLHPDDEAEVDSIIQLWGTKKIREEWPWIIVPFSIDMERSEIDGNWSEMKEYKL